MTCKQDMTMLHRDGRDSHSWSQYFLCYTAALLKSHLSRSNDGLIWRDLRLLIEVTNPFQIAWHSANAFDRSWHNSYYEVGRLPLHPAGFFFDERQVNKKSFAINKEKLKLQIDECESIRVIVQHSVDFRGKGHVNNALHRNATKLDLMPSKFFIYQLPMLYTQNNRIR